MQNGEKRTRCGCRLHPAVQLSKLTYQPPFGPPGAPLPFLHGDHVTDASGTGMVQTELLSRHKTALRLRVSSLRLFIGHQAWCTRRRPTASTTLSCAGGTTSTCGTTTVCCVWTNYCVQVSCLFVRSINCDVNPSRPVTSTGTFTPDAPADLAGLPIGTKGTARILELLQQSGLLVAHRPYKHRYPYDWRTKKPVILRYGLVWPCNEQNGYQLTTR